MMLPRAILNLQHRNPLCSPILKSANAQWYLWSSRTYTAGQESTCHLLFLEHFQRWRGKSYIFTISSQIQRAILLTNSTLFWVLTKPLKEEKMWMSLVHKVSGGLKRRWAEGKKRRKPCVRIIFMPHFFSCGTFLPENSHLQVNCRGFFFSSLLQ